MHQTRNEITPRLPLPRKGTKYVVRAASDHRNAVPVLIAIRDMLKQAHTTHEVQEMIEQKLLKINGRVVRDMHESVKLFNLFEADKLYCLSLLPIGKFVFKELAKPEDRLCKIISKRLVSSGKIQLNLHDGTNLLTKEKSIAVGDSLYLDNKNRVKTHLSIEKGREAFIIRGKHQGITGAIAAVQNSSATIQYEGGSTTLKKDAFIVIK